MFPDGNDVPCEYEDYGQGIFFNERGFIVKYFKEKFLYEKSSLKQNPYHNRRAGITQILYQSPMGSFVIAQDQVNNKIFKIYVSEDMKPRLFDILSRALEISLDLEPKSLEINFREKYKVSVDNAAPISALDEKKETERIEENSR